MKLQLLYRLDRIRDSFVLPATGLPMPKQQVSATGSLEAISVVGNP